MLHDVIEKSSVDPEFRALLKADPRGALRELGYEIAEGVNIVIAEDTPETLHLSLPADPWLETPSVQEVERTVTPPGMSVCSKSYSCCCGFSDPIEEQPQLAA